MFDCTMNYVQTKTTLSYFGTEYLHGYTKEHLEVEPMATAQFIEAIDKNLSHYDDQINQAQFNLLGSHDMARPLWILGENKKATQLSFLFMLTMPGAPCIYYGDEIAMSGDDDPGCREAYPWDQPEKQDLEMRDAMKEMIALRHQFPALRTGTFKFLNSFTDAVVQYQRQSNEQTLQIIINRSETPQEIKLPEGEVCFGSIENSCLPAQSAVVVKIK